MNVDPILLWDFVTVLIMAFASSLPVVQVIVSSPVPGIVSTGLFRFDTHVANSDILTRYDCFNHGTPRK